MAYCNRCGSDQHFGGQCAEKPIKAESKIKREWRNRNRERYNAYQRKYMREYRARKDPETATVHGDVRDQKGPEESER
jgi:hypothetical protein